MKKAKNIHLMQLNPRLTTTDTQEGEWGGGEGRRGRHVYSPEEPVGLPRAWGGTRKRRKRKDTFWKKREEKERL